jgi:glycosyltransferase involved in cell wall biosynthesis
VGTSANTISGCGPHSDGRPFVRIALNAWFMDQPDTGSGQYLSHLLAEYMARHAEHRFLLCSPDWGRSAGFAGQQAGPPGAPGQRPSPFEWQILRTPFDGRHRHLAKVWFEQISFPRACRRWGADVTHVPYWAAPLAVRAPVVVTIHDLIPVLLPAYRGGTLGAAYTGLVRLSARRADLVLTDSQASQRDILQHLRLPADRVETIYLAADDRYHGEYNPQAQEWLHRKYALPARYLLYMGGFDLRKNVTGVVQAFAQAELSGVDLVIAGRLPSADTPFTPDPRRVAQEMGISSHVHYPGWIDESDTPALYSGAIAFVFPSSYEGFGLPPLEAMACGTPVIVANTSSLPEVVGDGGLWVDPQDVAALSQTMRAIVLDSALRERMSRAALARARTFSWRQTAQATLDACQRICEKQRS